MPAFLRFEERGIRRRGEQRVDYLGLAIKNLELSGLKIGRHGPHVYLWRALRILLETFGGSRAILGFALGYCRLDHVGHWNAAVVVGIEDPDEPVANGVRIEKPVVDAIHGQNAIEPNPTQEQIEQP